VDSPGAPGVGPGTADDTHETGGAADDPVAVRRCPGHPRRLGRLAEHAGRVGRSAVDPPVRGGRGTADHADQRGAFLQGMLDYVDEGPESLDQMLADIDAGWPQQS
jgi:hypothetical protein